MTREEFIGQKLFDVCTSKSILEIGPQSSCFFTEEILKHNPTKVTLLEAAADDFNACCNKYQGSLVVNVIHGDMHTHLPMVGNVDVAILMGIMYHSHAPLYVLEELVNNCDPEIVIYETTGSSDGFGISCEEEQTNLSGMRNIITSKKTCNIVQALNYGVIHKAMQNLGYNLTQTIIYPAEVPRAGVQVFKFEKNHDR